MRSPDLPERVPLRPAVSVIMANYNGAAHLADAIRSIQGQTLRDLEIIVSDDASSDDSVRIVTELMAKDPRIRLVQGKRNGGPAAARNRALPLAKGEWIAVMDSDDLMHPDRLTTLVEAARRDNADMVADNLVEFDTSGSKPPRPLLSGRWARKPFWVEICRYLQLNHLYGRRPALGYLKPLFRKTILTGPTAYYDETLRIAEDYNLILRLLYAGRQMRVYPLPLYFYRKHSASISHRLNESALEALKATDVRFLGKISSENQPVAEAVKRHVKSVETALAFEKLLNAFKSRNWPAAIRIALTKPRAAALLRLPLGVRLRGLAPSQVPRIAVANPLVLTTSRLLHENQRGHPPYNRSVVTQHRRDREPTPPDKAKTHITCHALDSEQIAMESRTDTEPIELTVCICSFRRPSLLSTIDSVGKQLALPTANVRILIIDNDHEPTARNIAAEFDSRTSMRVDYRHVPGQNISTARNAGLDAAPTPWLAFVDDDEFASANWLAELVANRNGANAVFGPCDAIYDDGVPNWIKQGDYHSNRIAESSPITTGYTSNVLIDMVFVRRHGLRFEPELGRTGGEDTVFFHAMYRKGGVLKYAPNAVVYERVVPSRANVRWVVRRRYRAGQTRALVSHKFDRVDYRRVLWTAPLKVVACAIMSAVTLANRPRAMWWLMRGIFHCGTISYAIGAGAHEEYGKQAA